MTRSLCIDCPVLRELRGRVGARDAYDAALVSAIASEMPVFRAGEVFARAEASPSLRKALQAADIDNEWQLGKLLGRMDGVAVERTRRRRQWRVLTDQETTR